MMNTQDTNQKKTLKKGRKGWVVAAALVATLGAGTMLYNGNNSVPTPSVPKTGQTTQKSGRKKILLLKQEKTQLINQSTS